MEKMKRKRYHIFFFLVKKQNSELTETQDLKGPSRRNKTCMQVLLPLAFIAFFIFTFMSRPPMVMEIPTLPNRKLNGTHNSKSEVRHIAFLKVFKAGSSTIQNILFRFGSKRNLTFIIPVNGNKFSLNSKTHELILDPVKGKRYDILAMHAYFNQSTFAKYLPNDAVYIGIVRNPLDTMISGAYYNRDVWKVPYLTNVPKDKFIQNLIRYPERYDQQEFSLTRNTMAWVFGFPFGLHVHDDFLINRYLDNLDNIFDLVMIMEYFKESLVMLRRRLNWRLCDILYIPLNGNKHKTADELHISDLDRRKFETRNFLDIALYDHFHKVFMDKLSTQDEDFFAEVEHFKSVQRQVEVYCLMSSKSPKELIVSESMWNKRFLVTSEDCDQMKMPELDFVDKLRNRQEKELLASL